MWRSLIATGVIVCAVYAYGHPRFDGYRPVALDRALQKFHVEMNGAARSGQQALAQLDQRRAGQAIRSFVNRFEIGIKN